MVLISARESKEMIENIKGKSRSCVGGKSGAEYRICRNMGVCLLVSLFFFFLTPAVLGSGFLCLVLTFDGWASDGL